MKKLLAVFALLASGAAFGQTTTNVVTDNTTTTTNTTNSTNTNTNTNNNVQSGTATNNNNNVNTSTNVNTNNNVQSGTATNINQNTSTATSTNTNNNNSVSTSTNTNNNNNNNVSVSTNTNNNNSVSTSTNNNNNNNVSTSTNTNNNNNTSNSDNKNLNINKSESTSESRVKSDNTNTNINRNENITKVEQEIKSPPASAIAPMISAYSQDVCVSGVSGAVQTQLIGVSAGKAVRDMNCERLKLSKTLYDMGMKVAAVSMMCQDERVFKAMEMAGTPCPYMGKIGKDATEQWAGNTEERPDFKKKWWEVWKTTTTEDLPVAIPAGE